MVPLQHTVNLGSPNPAGGVDANLSGSYKNPWTSVSRPMNGFIDIRQDQWEQNELRKAQLAKDLKNQMDEVMARKEQAKKLQLAEEQAIEKKLLREREEIKMRD